MSKSSSNKIIIRSRSPLRISFAGGGTDVPPYPEMEGGATLSTTIDQYAYCTLSNTNSNSIQIQSHDYNISKTYKKLSDLKYDGNLDLVKASIKKTSAKKHGFKITLSTDSSPGTGLGSSSAVATALCASLLKFNKKKSTRYQLAKIAHVVERTELGIPGGMQDQYSSAFGGFNFIEFKKNSVVVNPLKLKNGILNELLASMILCDTNTSRISGNILSHQINSYSKKDETTLEHMRFIKDTAFQMKKSLIKGDIKSMADLLNDGWFHKKNLSKSISTKKIDSIYNAAINCGALGGKLLGAGGGGHLLFICDPIDKPQICKLLLKKNCNIVKFNFDNSGIQTWKIKNNKISS